MRHVRRSGPFYRLASPSWSDPLDTQYSMRDGGRWNPKGEFGALYLNATVEVAAANARHLHAKRAIKLFDLKPEARPQLLTVNVEQIEALDVVSAAGLEAIGFPATYPLGVDHARSQAVARQAYGTGGFAGVACRSNAEAVKGSWVGEELAVFDKAMGNVTIASAGAAQEFSNWYPDADPDSVRRTA